MIHTNSITNIRTRVACHLEAVAEALEQWPTPDATLRAAYDQGRADERQRILTLLPCWRDALPLDRSTATLRTTLRDITNSLQP